MRISPPSTANRLWATRARLVACASATVLSLGASASGTVAIAATAPEITFAQDIAPILYTHCATCHRPGEIGPFSLLTYDDARTRARQIAEVTRRRVMPPWKPAPGKSTFLDARTLTDAQIDLIERWVANGAAEGDPATMPARPTWVDGWQLGTPDLVVTMPEPYVLPADGLDVFRTFVLPIPLSTARFVRAIEFRPGNARVVHHANLGIDPTRASRRLDEHDAEPGHAGSMAQAASHPAGHMLGWTPGQRPRPVPDGMTWRLERDSDLVAGLHLQTTGKEERVQISVGFYFSDEAPRRAPVGLRLGSQALDIPPGARAYTVQDSYTLPVDADVIALQPHAHNLGRRVDAQATLPTGQVVPLISIGDWDFRWQDVYRLASPLRLPKGSRITMRFVYDNSAENVRNPFQPPRRVVWGQQTNDEMGDVWVQLVPCVDADMTTLATDVATKMRAQDLEAYTTLLRREPANSSRHDAVALLYLQGGQADRAVTHFRESVRLDPGVAATHYNLGLALAAAREYAEALSAFRQAVALDARHADAENNLGALLHATGRVDEAEPHYRRALALRPENAEAHDNLGRILSARGQRADAAAHFRAALDLRPDWARPMIGLAWLWATGPGVSESDVADAIRMGERAVAQTRQSDALALDALAAAYAAAGQFDRAVATARTALDVAMRVPRSVLVDEIRARLALYEGRRPFRLE